MSFRTVTSLHDAGMQMQIEGGEVFFSPDPNHGGPRIHVRCNKHPKVWVAIAVPDDFNVLVMQRRAQDAINSCQECSREQKSDWKNTRWPEGAEI